MPRIVVTAPLPEAGLRLLRTRSDLDLYVLAEPTHDCLAAAIGAADAVIMVPEVPMLTAALIAQAPRLRFACRFGAGYDNFDVPALTARRIPLLTTGDANAVAVAEHALYLMLAVAKAGVVHDRAARATDWGMRSQLRSIEIAGKHVLVVGFGRIGRAVARRCAGFDMVVEVFDSGLAPATIVAEDYSAAENLHDALPAADFVSLHLPLSPATSGMFGATELARMKPTAVLINTARGGVVDEAALIRALRERRIAGAGLDVLAVEPPARDNPLLAMDNVVLSPHAAASTKEAVDRVAAVCARNVLDALDGRFDRRFVVNPDVLPSA
jgi:D-3-phosphoglycerate dehydrogenase